MTVNLYLNIAFWMIIGIIFYIYFRATKEPEVERKDSAPKPQNGEPNAQNLPPELQRFAGRLIDGRWPKEVIDEIRKDYFPLPPAKQQFLVRVDLTATCPQGHGTMERVGILASTASMANKAANVLHKGRVEINCRECGKPAKIAGKSPVWEGVFGDWDGAT